MITPLGPFRATIPDVNEPNFHTQAVIVIGVRDADTTHTYIIVNRDGRIAEADADLVTFDLRRQWSHPRDYLSLVPALPTPYVVTREDRE